MRATLPIAVLAAPLCLGAPSSSRAAEPARPPLGVPLLDEGAIASRGHFYVGGEYSGPGSADVTMNGQMYVEVTIPREVRHSYPLIFIHGAGATGAYWRYTADGRMGWAEVFARKGYVVYTVDQPMRGRSFYDPLASGPLSGFDLRAIEDNFTATDAARRWPQARLHTQWPGTGKRSDPAFDAFFASQVEYVRTPAPVERANQAAGAALLDRTGPAI